MSVTWLQTTLIRHCPRHAPLFQESKIPPKAVCGVGKGVHWRYDRRVVPSCTTLHSPIRALSEVDTRQTTLILNAPVAVRACGSCVRMLSLRHLSKFDPAQSVVHPTARQRTSLEADRVLDDGQQDTLTRLVALGAHQYAELGRQPQSTARSHRLLVSVTRKGAPPSRNVLHCC
jgi:hypothetical protein